ncbi:MAG: hypothetical protein RSP_04670 [Rhodanobacter sp.]
MNTAKINAFESHAPILGARLFNLAHEWSRDLPDTKKERLAAISAVKGRKQIKGGVPIVHDLVMDAMDDICKARKLHQPEPPGYGWGHKPGRRRGRDAILLPRGTMEERLQRATRKWFLNAMINNIDLRVAGSEKYIVKLTRDPTQVDANASTWKDFGDQYKGAYKGWAKTAMRFEANVPHDWLTRVWRNDLEETGGLITLDAQHMDCRAPGVEVFSATWMRQGRGKSVVVEKGFIARTTDQQVSFHGATYASALAGLARKRRIATDGVEALNRESVERFASKWEKRADLVCLIEDAEAIGACAYGIQSWCHASALSAQLATGHATAAELAQAYRARPLPEVRSTILFAARRAEFALAA